MAWTPWTAEKTRPPVLSPLGLERWDGEWWPGLWHVVIMSRGDDVTYRLCAPFLPDGHIDLTVEEYDSWRAVHRAVLGATGTVCLDDEPGKWRRLWKGWVDRRTGRFYRGLEGKLLREAEEWAPCRNV
jgi:hypothetical protein